MIFIENRCKNMYIADLFTAHCDSRTELNAQGMNAEVRLRRRDHECCFTAQTCVRGPGPSLHKMNLQMTKVEKLILKRSRKDHPSGGINMSHPESIP